MPKKFNVTLFLIIIIGLTIYAHNLSLASKNSRNVDPPILDSSFDPEISFKYTNSYEETQGVLLIHEYWTNPEKAPRKAVAIDRHIFSDPKEIDEYMKSVGNINVCEFSGWDKTPDIGDKTHWVNSGTVVFSKGKLLVKVFVTILGVSAEEKREYTRRIAKYIEKKL